MYKDIVFCGDNDCINFKCECHQVNVKHGTEFPLLWSYHKNCERKKVIKKDKP